MANPRAARVAVVMPTYRRVTLLADALGSVLAQTYRDFVVLVCDNDDSDEVAELIARFGDPRLVHIRRPRNLGMVGNAIEGFREAGELGAELAIELDDDDMLRPTCLERLVAPFDEHPDLALSFGALHLIDEAGAPIPAGDVRETVPQLLGLKPGLYQPFTDLAVRGQVYMPAGLLRTDRIDWATLPWEVGTAYDRYLALEAARGGAGACYLDEPLVDYRIHPEADGVRQYVRQLGSVIALLETELRRATPRHARGYRRVVRDEIVRSRLRQSRALLRRRSWTELARALGPISAPPYWISLARIGSPLAGRVVHRFVSPLRSRE